MGQQVVLSIGESFLGLRVGFAPPNRQKEGVDEPDVPYTHLGAAICGDRLLCETAT
jgi:hypothetical protein